MKTNTKTTTKATSAIKKLSKTQRLGHHLPILVDYLTEMKKMGVTQIVLDDEFFEDIFALGLSGLQAKIDLLSKESGQ